MPVVINLNKSDSSVPWGFRLHGGKDFGAPLTVQRINPGSVAAKCGLQIGDAISVIDSVSTSGLKHKDAQDLIVKGGNSLQLTIFRGGEIPVRQIEASDPYVPFVVEKPSFKPTGETTTSPGQEYSLSSQVGSISISNDRPITPSFSSGAVPFKAPSISSKNASLYQPSLHTITSGLTKNHTTDFNKEPDDFPPPPPFPSAISPTSRSFTAPTGASKLHQPTQRFPEIVLNEEPVNGTNSSDTSHYVPSETYRLVKDMERGLDVPFNPKTGAGVRASPIQSKLVDILEKKHATLENDKFQEDTTPRFISPQVPYAASKNVSYGTDYRKTSLSGPSSTGKFLGAGVSNSGGNRSPSPQVPSKTSLMDQLDPTDIPICNVCKTAVRGAYVMAINKIWCPDHFLCSHPSCRRNLSETGFMEEQGQLYCKEDYERYFAPKCAKCNKGILGNTVKALKNAFHPECFTCHRCNQSILGGVFHLHEGNIYCDKDFSEFFSVKCLGCNFPIEVGDNWIEAVGTNWHGECFNCAVCRMNLQNTGFVHKEGRFLCKDHAKSQY